MALYLVVRHRLADPTFENVWQDRSDDLLTSIQTTVEIGNLCAAEQALNLLVYIHRCGFEHCPPTICCSVHVAEVAVIGGAIIVEFRDQTPLNIAPGAPPPPGQGQSYYHAPPPI
jgi:hypothetical protein